MHVLPSDAIAAIKVEAETVSLYREANRQDQHGEVFTPAELAIQALEKLPKDRWVDGQTFLDPTCGNGQLLVPVLIIKLTLGHANPLSTVYGVDLMPDNVAECQKRLLAIVGDTEENRKIVEWNIRQGDATTFDYENEFDQALKAEEDAFKAAQSEMFKW